ncbi:MAG: ABC transporter substrate-binding protein [Chloroflexota bacterium]|nr:ABC transporter substrate-binding protein [Chloroflexota bacterium]
MAKLRASLVLLTIVALVLAGCADDGKKTTPVPPTRAPGEPITLEFWYSLGGSSGEAVEALVAEFNQTHSGIRVNATYQGGYAEIMAKVWSAIYAQETLPHVAHVGAAPLLGDTGSIVPITDFLDGPDGIERSLIRDSFWDYNSAQGRIWSMPFNNSVPLLYYNRDLFVQAGLDPDSPPETWEEVIEHAKALTQDTDGNGEIDQWGFNTHKDTHWYLSAMFLENGARIISDDETEVLYNGPEAVEMLELWGSFVTEHKIMPPAQHNEAKSDFLAGKLGMVLASSSNLPSFLEEVPFELGAAHLPSVAGKDPVEPIGGASLVIFQNGDQAILDAAWEFVKWMTSPQGSLYLSMNTGYVPIYEDALNWPDLVTYLEETPLRRVPMEALEYSYAIPVFISLGTSDGQLRRAVESVELGAATAQDALNAAKIQVDADIAERLQEQGD